MEKSHKYTNTPPIAFALRLEFKVVRQLGVLLDALGDLHLVPVLVLACVTDELALEIPPLLQQIPVEGLGGGRRTSECWLEGKRQLCHSPAM